MAFYLIHRNDDEFKDDNMSDEGWNEKYNR